tara:strand:- start:19783 stop:22194 length:2412 start_codon:yes stop_codon:yes gene_type:complete
MIITDSNSIFPDQVVPEEVKASYEYGLQVGKAIEGDWFSGTRTGLGNRYSTQYNNFRNLRLYARAEQSIQKYKDELSINGDLSYLNLDWKPIPVLPKFVDIVVNGMSEKIYEVKAYAQDPESLKQRTTYAQNIIMDIETKDFIDTVNSALGVDLHSSADPANMPQTKEELDVHMQLDYKQSVEIAEEELISNVLDFNKYELTRRRINYDLTVLGIGAVKTCWNKAEGVTVDYVDPAHIVYSYTDDPNFEDIWYVGEVKRLSLADLKKEFPNLTNEQLERIQKYPNNSSYVFDYNARNDGNSIYVLYFEYKTYHDQVFKIKQTNTGLEKALEKPDTFNPPANDNFDRVSRSIEVLYSGAKILGHDDLLRWELAKNMTRPTSNLVKVNMNYNICAPRMYKGRIESLVSRITGFADMIQLTHLKLQQVMSRVVPDGVYLDADGLAEVDLGNGTSYNPQEALNMYFQTGSIIGRSMTQDGGMNPGKVPIQELSTNSGQAKIQSLISTYQYYLQMIRDVTGLNEARDGSAPAKDALVGLQKLAIANSNTATRHLVQASMYLTAKTCENIALRVNDTLEFDLTKESLRSAISSYNVGTLEDLYNLNIFDFGIYLELKPDEEEKAQLEQNIQVALQSGQIYLEDAIDIRNVNNIKLANQLLKFRRKKKQQQDQQAQQANIQAQAQANAQATEAAAVAEVQKQQALADTQVQIETAKNNLQITKLEREAEVKRQLMEIEFDFNMQLTRARAEAEATREKEIEDRKDKRTRISGSQQSQMIDQRKNDSLPINFESAGNDTLGGFGLEQFAPQ